MLVRKTLSDQIYESLRKDIIRGKIPLGSKLINRQLQKDFGVSSSPIRDAINRLQQDGLIVEVNNTGATIINLEYDSYQEINQILKYIIIVGMDICHEKELHKELYEELEKINDIDIDIVKGEKYYSYDYDFHKVFIDKSGNSHLKKHFKQYNALHELLVKEYHEKVNNNSHYVGYEAHKEIAEAVRMNNIKKAIKLTKDHYDIANSFFENLSK